MKTNNQIVILKRNDFVQSAKNKPLISEETVKGMLIPLLAKIILEEHAKIKKDPQE